MTIVVLPLIEKVMGLVATIQYRYLALIDNIADKRPFSSFAFSEKQLLGSRGSGQNQDVTSPSLNDCGIQPNAWIKQHR